MRVFAGITAALMAAILSGGGGQAAPGEGPKELPPAGYAGNQYVDSAGCVFLRAGLGGQTTWVPRVGRDRNPVCGYEPTFPPGMLDAAAAVAGGAEAEPAAEPAAEPTVTPAATPAPQPAVPQPAAKKPAAKAVARKKPAKPAAPATIALVRQKTVAREATYCADRIDAAQRYLLSDGRRVTQCAETAAGPAVPYLNGLGVPGLTVTDRPATAREVRRAEAADQGDYRVTFARGRLTAAGQAAMARPAAAAAAAPYVQIGAFAQSANAERAIATLNRLGLPVSVGVGGGLQLILAGPFANSADLSRALTLVRQNGYRDAFPTRG